MTQAQRCSASVFGSKNGPGHQCQDTVTAVSWYNDEEALPVAWKHARINTSLCADHVWLAQEDGSLDPEQFYVVGSRRNTVAWEQVGPWICHVGGKEAGLSRLGDIARQSRDYAVLVDGTGRIVACTAACGDNSCYCRVRSVDATTPNIFYQRAIRQLIAEESEVVQ